MKKLLLILLVIAIPAVLFADAMTEGFPVKYPYYLVKGEEIIIRCPICKRQKLKSTITPMQCTYQRDFTINEEGVYQYPERGTITCSHMCSNGHFFMWKF